MKTIIQKIINWIKSLFEQPDKKQAEVKTIEDYIPLINKNESLKLFSQIRIGDIIYAPSCFSLSRLKNLEESHRQRPFIVVRKEADRLICFCGTSNKDTNYTLGFHLDKQRYKVSKDGNINLNNLHEIPDVYIISIADHLTIADMLKINEIILSSHSKSKDEKLFKLKVDLKPGMIIAKKYESKEFYFVYKVDDIYATLYLLNKNPLSKIQLRFRKNIYYIDVNKPKTVRKDDNFVVLKTDQFSTLKAIKDKFYRIEASSRSKRKPTFEMSHYFKYEIGQVFVTGMRTFVYLFSSNNQNYGIEIYDNESISNLITIKCNMEYLHEDGMLEKDEILDVVSETAERSPSCIWLYDLVKNQYGIVDKIEMIEGIDENSANTIDLKVEN